MDGDLVVVLGDGLDAPSEVDLLRWDQFEEELVKFRTWNNVLTISSAKLEGKVS